MNQTWITNPVIWADVPDPSVIRVNSTYYMVSTSMHSMPGCPIMKSENLQNWELVSYVFETLEDNDAHNLLDGKDIYGKGSWAASLRYHQGRFYVCFASLDMNRFYIFQTHDIEQGPWERHVIEGLYHDASLLFDDDGRVFIIYGNGKIHIAELNAEATALKPDGIHQFLFETPSEGMGLRAEGCHAYKINNYYYLFFIDWPNIGHRRRRVQCYRSKRLLGPYEHRLLLDDDMGYRNKGVAQGGIIDTPTGDWFAVLFQDHDAVGRVPCVVPVKWEDDWPVFGVEGKVPTCFQTSLPSSTPKPFLFSDEFDYAENKLALPWQWNHNPDHRYWSVTVRPSHLRLMTSALADRVEFARNTLTQRTVGPACSAVTVMDIAHMRKGDHAGLVALQYHYGTIGIRVAETGERDIAMCVRGEAGREKVVERKRYEGERIHLRVEFEFEESVDTARFYYSDDGIHWSQLGSTLQLQYTLDHFMGCRIGLFNYATMQPGGYVDFDYCRFLL